MGASGIGASGVSPLVAVDLQWKNCAKHVCDDDRVDGIMGDDGRDSERRVCNIVPLMIAIWIEPNKPRCVPDPSKQARKKNVKRSKKTRMANKKIPFYAFFACFRGQFSLRI